MKIYQYRGTKNSRNKEKTCRKIKQKSKDPRETGCKTDTEKTADTILGGYGKQKRGNGKLQSQDEVRP